MKRNNPSLATSPNAPIDLTSLLDIVFIILFVAIIGIKKNTQDVDAITASMNSVIAEKESEKNAALSDNESLMADNKLLMIENKELQSLVDEYYETMDEKVEEDFKKEYARLGERVSIITITCEYKNDHADADEFRTNMVTLAFDGETYNKEDFSFQANLNMDEKLARLETIITRQVDDFPNRIYIIEIEGRQTNNVIKELNNLRTRIVEEYKQVF